MPYATLKERVALYLFSTHFIPKPWLRTLENHLNVITSFCPPSPSLGPWLPALFSLSPDPLILLLVLLSIHDEFISGFWNKKTHPLVDQCDQKPSSTQVVLGHPFPALHVYLMVLLNSQVSALMSSLETSRRLFPLHWEFHPETPEHIAALAQFCTRLLTGLCCHCQCLLPPGVTLSFGRQARTLNDD